MGKCKCHDSFERTNINIQVSLYWTDGSKKEGNKIVLMYTHDPLPIKITNHREKQYNIVVRDLKDLSVKLCSN